MKKLLWLIPVVWAAVLLLTWEAWAAGPYLACDWQAGITASEVEVNGTIIPGTVVQSGTDMLLLDLQGYSNGSYTFRARFIGQGGWPSEWSSPFSAEKPASGGALRIKR